jgi:hypothetical protein
MSDKIDARRRKFLSQASKVVAGASISAMLGGKGRVAQGMLAEVAMAGGPENLLAMVSLLAARPAELGTQVFAAVPQPLRSCALQIESVLAGIKPACRLSLWVADLPVVTAYLKGLSCAMAIEQVPVSQSSYAQTNLERRAELMARPRVRLYLAKSAADARRLANWERENDYRQLGLGLGYPGCCVDAAIKHDNAYFDEENQAWRQTNLNSITVSSSSAADFRCNQFLVESGLHYTAPVSAIAHYPCRLDCSASVSFADAALQCSARKWPIWTVTLCELLRAPIVYWTDKSWPADYWDEYCGLALIEASQTTAGQWNSPLPAIILGSHETPAGSFPQDVVSILVGRNQILLQGAVGKTTTFRFDEIGEPWLINWHAGKVRKVTSQNTQ